MSGAAAGAAAAAAIANATKASGAIVRLPEEEFKKLLRKADHPLVVGARGGLFYSKYRYLFSYKGLFFTTLMSDSLSMPSGGELIWAERIWIPN